VKLAGSVPLLILTLALALALLKMNPGAERSHFLAKGLVHAQFPFGRR
jgi:hypothetical protein